MSFQFADIFEQELKSLGVSLPPSPEQAASTEAVTSVAFYAPAIRLEFSSEAQSLSSSMRHYAQDSERLRSRDSGIIAGSSELGYLMKVEGGIQGELHFETRSGSQVHIAASSPEDEPSMDIHISVVRDGQEFHFDMEEIADGPSTPLVSVVSPFPALECGSALDEDSAVLDVEPHESLHSASVNEENIHPDTLTYSPNGSFRPTHFMPMNGGRHSPSDAFTGHV